MWAIKTSPSWSSCCAVPFVVLAVIVSVFAIQEKDRVELLVDGTHLTTDTYVAHQKSGSTFRAAVFQHYRVKNASDPVASIMANVARYEDVAAEASSNGVQIIVFPEVGLGSNEVDRALNMRFGEDVPDASMHITPCDHTGTSYCAQRPGLCALSCMAKRSNLYAVVGMNDRKACNRTTDPLCPADNNYLFNTAVVFDNQGQVVCRYHKKHIFSPIYVFDVPTPAEVKSFNTSFGVEFGVFVCFDSLFPNPPLELIERGLRHFVFPTSWTNVPPILSALPYQQAWSREFNSTFLAANTAVKGTSGSGMYVCGEVITSFFNATGTGETDEMLLVADIPTATCQPLPQQQHSQQALQKKQSQYPQHKTPLASLTTSSSNCGSVGIDPCACDLVQASPGKTGVLQAEFRGLKCVAQYSFSENQTTTERFGLIAYSGEAWFLELLNIQLCAFVRCANEDSCLVSEVTNPALYDASTLTSSLSIQGNFTSVQNSKQFILASVDKGQLLPPTAFTHMNDTMASTSTPVWPARLAAASILVRIWNDTSTTSNNF
eukprot:m.4627 g.4627  ORF g.4627 m.4627 type:complete len:547 (+) comp2266_c0_seq1:35-1675(+)